MPSEPSKHTNGHRPAHDPVLDALDEVIWQLPETIDQLRRALQRAEVVHRCRLEGKAWSDILGQAGRPLIVELLTTNLTAIARFGHELRTAEARALHAEGLTMDRIAQLFGVSRQRVSALLSAVPARHGEA